MSIYHALTSITQTCTSIDTEYQYLYIALQSYDANWVLIFAWHFDLRYLLAMFLQTIAPYLSENPIYLHNNTMEHLIH